MLRLTHLTDALWNPWLLGLFLLAGSWFSLRSGFFQLTGLGVWTKATLGTLWHPAGGRGGRGISQAQALCTALASTIGTGSIAGVATAIWFGGPGSVFWMWVSAILGMMISFVEKTLVICYRRRGGDGGWLGGPMYYLRDGLGSRGLAVWFALACLCATFAGGNLVQASSIASSMESAFGLGRCWVGGITAGTAALVMLGGIGRIAGISTLLVPVMAVLYVGGGVLVLILRGDRLPEAVGMIVSCALSPQAVLGGGAGYTISSAMRFGIARGVFTNEAGVGTSAMAHSAADVDHPARQGMWGILEVGVSTLLICSVTALVILVSGVYDPRQGALGQIPACGLGAAMTTAAFSEVLGELGGWVVAISLLLFAFSSILGWSYYGQQCIAFLTGREGGGRVYRILFLLCILWGSLMDSTGVWVLVDFCNAMAAIPNMVGLLCLSGKSLSALEKWRQMEERKSFFQKPKKRG